MSPSGKQNNNKRSYHVAYIVSGFPHLPETFILREMNELKKRSAVVSLFPLRRKNEPVYHSQAKPWMEQAYFTPYISPAIIAANLYYLFRHPFKYLGLWMFTLWFSLPSPRLFVFIPGILTKAAYFTRVMQQIDVDHVHAHFATHPAAAAFMINWLAEIPYSFTAHAHDIFVNTAMLCAKLKRAAFVVAISEFNKRLMRKLCPAVLENKIHVIHCGVDPQRFYPVPRPTARTPWQLLCVASLQEYKGQRYLIEACHILRQQGLDFECRLVGRGKDLPKLERQIAESGLSDCVHLLGPKSQDEVADLMTAADAFVLPSVVQSNRKMEGIPVALMEALASELPVVSTRISGIPELVEDGVSGLLVPPRDAQALADALLRLYHNRAEAAAMGRHGREKVLAEFVLPDNVTCLNKLFLTYIHGNHVS
jgi:glycosyltransferase involved in cell wall biosynthesis